MAKLLLIDDTEPMLAECFARPQFADRRWAVDRVTWTSCSVERLRAQPADLVVASVYDRRHISDFLRRLREPPFRLPTIAVLAHDTNARLLSECMMLADDFVVCPLRPFELEQRITRVLASSDAPAESARERLNAEYGLAHLVGNDSRFVREIGKIPLAARSGCEVLVTGETGTGKELCARAIHHLSPRRSFPFICVDCGALPDQLFENEIFGHERGAFTDAHRAQKGLVALAEQGTLFLDEVDSLSLGAQAKLLRFLQDRTYKPLGSEHFACANVRIVVATNRNLQQAVQERAFRNDLLFRVNVLQMRMIPLRERRGDIQLLAQHFVDRCCAEMQTTRKLLAPGTVQLLSTMDWPGNIRELYNVARRAVVFCESTTIFPSAIQPASEPDFMAPATLSFRDARAIALTAFERQYVEDMLRRHNGNITHAAHEAGKERRAFGRLVKRHCIDPDGLG